LGVSPRPGNQTSAARAAWYRAAAHSLSSTALDYDDAFSSVASPWLSLSVCTTLQRSRLRYLKSSQAQHTSHCSAVPTIEATEATASVD